MNKPILVSMSQTTTTNAAREAGHFSTHIGFAEYDGNQFIYDGNFEPCKEGTREEVVAYLQELLALVNPQEEKLRWQGGNGYWLMGDDARASIKAEILDPFCSTISDCQAS